MTKIRTVEPFVVSHELEREFYFSQWKYDTRSICLVKITCDDGTFGWGEGYGPAQVIKSGIEFFRPLLIGYNPLEIESLWQMMYLRSLDYARRGILLSALSAIDVALWDLRGKILGQPVSVLLGGRRRKSVRTYATGMYFTETESLSERLAQEALGYKEQGFDAMKMKVGLNIEKDIENVQTVRQAIGSDIDLMIDANHAYSLPEAIKLAQAVESSQISWFEEPVSPEYYSSYSQLRQTTSIPIAGGECEYLRWGFLNLFQQQCVDIAQPDICAAGGITEVKRIADMANTFGVDLVPHTWGTGIALSAALHLTANIDMPGSRLNNAEALMELDRTENPLRDELVQPTFSPHNGRLQVPDKPGLGVNVDEDALTRYLLK
ncbi:MAG: mandelate racemase/muconate lactonizing enzyme family protein [Phycisphaerales bacterium]|nr:MAG: mandelate racemase/muconate lactonizing enzyme family protein [Phycisphaerales bacterium]